MSRDYFALTINGGFVELSFNLGTQQALLIIRSKVVFNLLVLFSLEEPHSFHTPTYYTFKELPIIEDRVDAPNQVTYILIIYYTSTMNKHPYITREILDRTLVIDSSCN